MTIYLTEADVKELLDMESTIDALDGAFKARARGKAFKFAAFAPANRARVIQLHGCVLAG